MAHSSLEVDRLHGVTDRDCGSFPAAPILQKVAEMNTPIDILRLWMLAAGTTQSAMAEALGVSRSSMSKYINGNQRVSLQFACDVEKLTGGLVPPRYWLFEEESA